MIDQLRNQSRLRRLRWRIELPEFSGRTRPRPGLLDPLIPHQNSAETPQGPHIHYCTVAKRHDMIPKKKNLAERCIVGKEGKRKSGITH
jgi:hypothetical protein